MFQNMIDDLCEAMDDAFTEYLSIRDFRSALTIIEARQALEISPPDTTAAASFLEEWVADFPMTQPEETP